MKLTTLEKDVLQACYHNEYHSGGPDDLPGVWSWSVADNCGVCKENQVCGVMSSLSKKEIVNVQPYEEDDSETVVYVTAVGHAIATELGYNV